MTTPTHTPTGTQIAVFRAHRDVDVEMMRSYVEIGEGRYWTVEALAWSPDERYWASGGADDSLRVWDFAAQRQVKVYPWDRSRGHILDMVWSPDGAYLAVLAGKVGPHSVVVLDAFSGSEVCMKFDVAGAEIIWPPLVGDEVISPLSVDAHLRDSSRTWSPDGRYYLMGSGEAAPPTTEEAPVAGSAPRRSDSSRNGRHITAHRVRVIEAATRRVALTLPHGMSWLAWSPARNALAGSHGKVVTVWDASAPESPLCVYHGHAGWFTHITCLSWSASGRRIASGDSAGVVHLWQVPGTG